MPPESGARAARIEGEPARGRFYTGISTLRLYASVCVCVHLHKSVNKFIDRF